MITLDDLESLKREVERRQQEKDRAEGALRSIVERLKAEMGVGSLKEARQELKKAEKERDRLMAEYTAARESFLRAMKVE